MDRRFVIILKVALVLLVMIALVIIFWVLRRKHNKKKSELGNGLKNTNGLNCYANTLFQTINNVDILRNYFSGISDESRTVSMEVKKILNKLNTPSKVPIDISEHILKIINAEGNGEILKPNKMNDVAELYDAIMSSAIKEGLNVRYKKSIFHDSAFFDNNNVSNSYLINNCTIKRKPNVKNMNECNFSLFLCLDYQSNQRFEEAIQECFYTQYKLESSGTELVVLLFENGALKAFDMILQENLLFNSKSYTLKSICVNKGGDNGHYIARIIKNNKIIEYNDSVVSEHKLDLSKPQGNVRLAFYEAKRT